MTNQAQMGFWEQYLAPLGRRYVDHFIQATINPKTEFFKNVLESQLFTGETYMAIENRTKVTDRSHYTAEAIVKAGCQLGMWQSQAYFTNPMTVMTSEKLSPTERCILAGYHTFTYEFDRHDVEFLKEQLDWLPRGQAWQKSPIGLLFAHCSKYPDFKGITVAYSGNKSLHIHIIFDTCLYRALHCDKVLEPAAGLRAHWSLLSEAVISILKPSPTRNADGSETPMKPDRSMMSPVAYRRLPGGTRMLERANLLGMPAGTRVPQIVLWERFRERAAQGAESLFFSPSLFAKDPMADKRPAAARSTRLGGTLTPEELTYCEAELRKFFPGPTGLILSDVRFDPARNEYCAHFFNGPNDKTPSSVQYESHATVLLCGSTSDVNADDEYSIPCSLGKFIELCCERLAQEKAKSEGCSESVNYWYDDDGELNYRCEGPSERRIGAPFAFVFQQSVVDNASAQSVMKDFLPKLIDAEPITLIRGPEGVSKTTSIIREHHVIMEKIRLKAPSGLAMYCFADYDNVLEKIDSFNQHHFGGPYYAVLWPSFSKTYQEVCAELRLTPLSEEEERRSGYRPLIELIRRKQPGVIEEFKKRHRAMWDEIGDREPVIFTVHAVAQQWQNGNQSRTMWAKSRWIDVEDARIQRFTLMQETSLALLVHDEVKWSTFADAIDDKKMDWLQKLPTDLLEAHRKNEISNFRKRLDKHVARVRWPDIAPVMSGDVQRYLTEEPWDEVSTAETDEYLRRPCDDPELDIYAKRYGHTWHLRARRWWTSCGRQIAERIVFLTTEMVPTAVAEKAHPGLYIVDLEAEQMRQDPVEVRAHRAVNSDNMERLCKEIIAHMRQVSGGDWFGISNKAPIEDVLTHAKARGSNALIGRNIVQTCGFMAPDEFELHQALNAWTGRRDLVTWRHIDEINQSAGRNLGFRHQAGVRHVLLINLRLYQTLVITGAFSGLRYRLIRHVDNDQRKNAKAAASLAATVGEL